MEIQLMSPLKFPWEYPDTKYGKQHRTTVQLLQAQERKTTFERE